MSLMRAARLHQIGGEFQLDEIAVPEVGPQDVLVKVAASTIIPNLKNVTTHFPEWYPFLPLPKLPAILGLDSAGVVAEVGSEVTHVKVGDRVYVNPGVGCGQCSACRAGDAPRCAAYTFLGYFGFGPHSQQVFKRYPYAGYGQYMTAPANSLVKLPENLSFAQATRFGYLGTAYAGLCKSGLKPAQSILILGASGTLGVGATLLALAFGAARVYVAARDDKALARLQKLDPKRVVPIDLRLGLPSGQVLAKACDGVDVLLDTLGAKAPAELSVDAMQAVTCGGKIVQIGGVAGPIPIEPHPFMCAQHQYIGSLWFSSVQGDELARLVECGLVDLSQLEERAYPLEELNQALEDIQTQANGFVNFHIAHNL